MLSLARIAELDARSNRTPDGMTFGANVDLDAGRRGIARASAAVPSHRRRFGSPQIRNVATLVGNVANGSPIADSLPLLLVMDAELEIAGPEGPRRRSINGFYTGYKKMDLATRRIHHASRSCRCRIPNDGCGCTRCRGEPTWISRHSAPRSEFEWTVDTIRVRGHRLCRRRADRRAIAADRSISAG